MKKIAIFEKVSPEQFEKDVTALEITGIDFLETHKALLLPRRSTKGAAGYDFFLPYAVTLEPREEKTIPTGMRVKIEAGWMLSLYPRSGLGFRYRLQLNNTVGIIDADYYNADNEGHIMARIWNGSKEILSLEKGKAFMQGVFLTFGITIDDTAEEIRRGGFGSTDA